MKILKVIALSLFVNSFSAQQEFVGDVLGEIKFGMDYQKASTLAKEHLKFKPSIDLKDGKAEVMHVYNMDPKYIPAFGFEGASSFKYFIKDNKIDYVDITLSDVSKEKVLAYLKENCIVVGDYYFKPDFKSYFKLGELWGNKFSKLSTFSYHKYKESELSKQLVSQVKPKIEVYKNKKKEYQSQLYSLKEVNEKAYNKFELDFNNAVSSYAITSFVNNPKEKRGVVLTDSKELNVKYEQSIFNEDDVITEQFIDNKKVEYGSPNKYSIQLPLLKKEGIAIKTFADLGKVKIETVKGKEIKVKFDGATITTTESIPQEILDAINNQAAKESKTKGKYKLTFCFTKVNGVFYKNYIYMINNSAASKLLNAAYGY